MKNTCKATLVALFFPIASQAANLGTFGDIWDIREHNFLAVINEKLTEHLQGKNEEQMQEELRQRVTESAMRPMPVDGIQRGRETRIRQFDPAYTVTRDMADQKGNVFAHAGQRVSPFDVIPVFNQTLYFIDGDDAEQIDWMKKQVSPTAERKIILVNGNIRDSADMLDSRIYFDQNGALTTRFDIRQVPAIVEQEPGKPLLRITEVGMAP
ncbi:type-F conjugative transfer system protein TraW [Serratia sp. UGAL515B_01]|uniref:type-F conjugative transfer system protein TraW n=1 Tax=Serratia sp. UGAL515B_01 TaxID=2986763 RepID=UPI002952EAFC|nr:type-F conjugative transfer system protein TraW [Serratia sp. UGAL515B_01]WON75529.1 type-F conjugative transfer system protein TraW [Serratia sp. UGAL515B_01]